MRFLSFVRALCRFGALIQAGLPADLALSLAEEKLAHAKKPFSLTTLRNNETAFALLSRRIFLHFRPLRSSTTTMASNLVARHLQVAEVVPIHRRFIISESPSEPFIIEAAARMMATPGFTGISCLLNFTNEELIDECESGEIAGRLLTIDAYDVALRRRSGSPIYHSWVPVLGFLEALFTDEVYKKIIEIRFGSKLSEVVTLQAERRPDYPGRDVYFIDVYGRGLQRYHSNKRIIILKLMRHVR